LRLSAHDHTLPADDFAGTDGCAWAAIGLARAITSDRGLSAQQQRGHSTISRSSSAGATLAPNGSRAGSTADRGGYAKYCFTRRRQPDGYRDAIRPSCQFGHGDHGPRHPDPARSVPDVLNTVPGLNVVQTGGPGGQTSVFMRGTNSNHTKVLVDGIDVSDPSTPNGAFDFAHLLAADIQQLEVLRGPQSGLYGSDAIGGIISIVTQKGDGSPRATASIETGSFKTFNQTAGLSGSQDNFNYALNDAHLHAGDIPVTPHELMPPGQKANGNNYDNMTYSTKLGADINEYWSVNSVVRYTDATLLFTGDRGFPGTPNPTQSTHAVQQFFTREEAVSSLLDGRIKNYFAVNYANNRSSDIAPGDPVATVTTGERIKIK
jgi:hypothetical protein